MKLFQQIFFAAVLAGAVAGLALSAIQQWRVVPLILEAELYENGEAHDHSNETATNVSAETHAHSDTDVHDVEIAEMDEPWAPDDGVERMMFTVLATTLVSLGFALVLAAISILVGIEIRLANGIYWGLGGFLAFAMAPAFGLSPELPGMPTADVGARQIWWWATAIVTGAAILGVAKFRTPTAIAIALVAIAIPHLVGAPQPPHDPSDVPAHLATSFAAATLTAAMVFWLALGVLLGWFNQRFQKGAT